MYLSKLQVSTYPKKGKQMIGDIHLAHAVIMSAFRDYGENTGRVLYRLEPQISERAVEFLIQSENMPEWRITAEDNEGLILSSAVKEFELNLKEQSSYFFRLRANPVVTIDDKRVPLVGEERHKKWLLDRLCKNGFHTENELLTANKEGYLYGYKKGKRITLNSVLFEGYVSVMDSEKAQKLVQKGVGYGKGLGFGLISLRRG